MLWHIAVNQRTDLKCEDLGGLLNIEDVNNVPRAISETTHRCYKWQDTSVNSCSVVCRMHFSNCFCQKLMPSEVMKGQM